MGTALSQLACVSPASLPLRESPASTRGQALRFQVGVQGLGGRKVDRRQGRRRDFPAHGIRPALMGWSPVRICSASQEADCITRPGTRAQDPPPGQQDGRQAGPAWLPLTSDSALHPS
ncbi:unnamed protein product [Rangifer tarandus platyrhynchus]|uniref:Uncharacterized protein n=2 Tax=Rangifer tarandus platyrhynchus TaxID=3082113 RepID=A0ABN9A7Y5_RANTA|nr:unnamed protein product [Rangifer tarandus platyrhynchus]